MGKIYGKVGEKKRNSKKKKNEHNRRRNVIMNFRVTPKEKELIKARVALTGMKRTTFFLQSCLYQKILVKGNIRTFSDIRDSIRKLSEQMEKNPDLTDLEPQDAERLRTILEILNSLLEKGV